MYITLYNFICFLCFFLMYPEVSKLNFKEAQNENLFY